MLLIRGHVCIVPECHLHVVGASGPLSSLWGPPYYLVWALAEGPRTHTLTSINQHVK